MQVTLTEAAFRLGRSYPSTLNLVLTKRLKGERREGRWFVDADSLEQLDCHETERRNTSTSGQGSA